MAVSLQDVLDLLASLNGEDSAPDNVSRKRFVNEIGADIWSRRRWSWAKARTSITLDADGTKALPANFDLGGFVDLRIEMPGSQDDIIYSIIDETERDRFSVDDHVCWITGEPGEYTIHTLDADSPTLAVVYDAVWSKLADSGDECAIPRAMPIAMGAFMLLKAYDDPESDTSEEFGRYEREIEKLTAQDNRNLGPRRYAGKTERAGFFLGDVR